MKAANDQACHLLLGMIAVQLGIITRAQLVDAVSTWLSKPDDPGMSLGDWLEEQRLLNPSQNRIVQRLVDDQLAINHGDASACVRNLPSDATLLQMFDEIGDPSLSATVSGFSTKPANQDQVVRATLSHVSQDERFVPVRHFAKGGLGEILVANDRQLNREVAVKRIQDWIADDAESQSRFILEAEITGALEHPGIVPVYGLSKDSTGRPYYAMRLVKGKSLREAISEFHSDTGNPFRAEAVVGFRRLLGQFIDVCQAVEYAHSRGVIHRDIKPANIILGPYGETLLVDWGLAKLVGQANEPQANIQDSGQSTIEPVIQPSRGSLQQETIVGTRIGTPGYMSPEQATGQVADIDHRSDVYSLGATLYSLLTGRSSIDPQSSEWNRLVETGNFPDPVQIQSSVPKALVSVCLRAMHVDRNQRYDSAKSIAEDIERWMADEPITSHRENTAERINRFYRRHRTQVFAGMILLAISSFGLAAFALVTAGQNRTIRAERDLSDALAMRTSDLAYEMMNTAAEKIGADKGDYGLQSDLIGSSLEAYRELAKAKPQDLEVRKRLAEGLFKHASLLWRSNKFEEADRAFEECIAEYGEILQEKPTDAVRLEKVGVMNERMIALQTAGDIERAKVVGTNAQAEIQEAEAQDSKEFLRQYGSFSYRLGSISMAEANCAEATSYLASAADQFGALYKLSLKSETPVTANRDGWNFIDSLILKAQSERDQDKLNDALQTLEQAVEASEAIHEADPTRHPKYYRANSRFHRGTTRLRASGIENPTSKSDLDFAVEEFAELQVSFPKYLPYKQMHAKAKLGMAGWDRRGERWDDATKALEEVEKMVAPVVEKYDTAIDWKAVLVDARKELAMVRNSTGLKAEALSTLQKAIEIQTQIVEQSPNDLSAGRKLDDLQRLAQRLRSTGNEQRRD